MTGEEIRDMDSDEIIARRENLQEEQFKLRFRSATSALENPMLLRRIRRDIARLNTILRERELATEETR